VDGYGCDQPDSQRDLERGSGRHTQPTGLTGFRDWAACLPDRTRRCGLRSIHIAAATANPGSAGVDPGAFNLLFKSALPDFTVAGKRDDTDGGLGQTLAGTYTVSFNGTGTIKLSQPAAENFVTYLLDNSKNNPIQHFIMINVDPANKDSAIIFAER